MPDYLVYTFVAGGIALVGGIVSLIIAIIIWRKMWVAGKTFAELGQDGNAIMFMSVLVVLCGLIASRIKKARERLE